MTSYFFENFSLKNIFPEKFSGERGGSWGYPETRGWRSGAGGLVVLGREDEDTHEKPEKVPPSNSEVWGGI